MDKKDVVLAELSLKSDPKDKRKLGRAPVLTGQRREEAVTTMFTVFIFIFKN